MRVLTVAFMIAVSACYDPAVTDCQFACGPNQTCPDGASCNAGMCRTRSTGMCALAADAPEVCPGAPASPSDCSTRFTFGGTACGVVCDRTRKSWPDAVAACMPGWRLAVLETAARRNAVPTSADPYWVGARRLTPTTPWFWTTGQAVEDSAWDGGAAPAAGVNEDCALFDRQKGLLVNDVPCGDTERFICTYP